MSINLKKSLKDKGGWNGKTETNNISETIIHNGKQQEQEEEPKEDNPVGRTLLATVVNKPEKTYILNTEYDLSGGSVELPYGVVLEFEEGGSIINGTLIGNRTIIRSDFQIFKDLKLKGSWGCPGMASWFTTGCRVSTSEAGISYISGITDDTKGIQDALDSTFGEIIFPPRPYYVSNTLILRNEKKLTLQGQQFDQTLAECSKSILGSSVIFTDKNITLLKIAVNEGTYHSNVTITGGNFDVSKCTGYTGNCIEVRTDDGERMWGLNINTTIRAAYNNTKGVGININPVENRSSEGYVTQIRINSVIANFGTGVKAINYMNELTSTYYNWCTDVVVDGAIINCPLCVESNTDIDIRAMLQAGYFWGYKQNSMSLIRYTGVRAAVSANIYDIQLSSKGKFSNEFAMEVTRPDAVVMAYGMFAQMAMLSKRLGWSFAKGPLYGVCSEVLGG